MSKTPHIIAVVVTYNPEEQFAAALESYIAQVAHVMVVDNSTEKPSKELLKLLKKQHGTSISVVHNKTNIGLAAAQNIGIQKALKKKADWVLLMDDDSLASKKMVAAQLNGYKKHPEKEKIAIIAADILDINTKHEQPFITHFGPFGFTRRYAKNPYLSGVLCAIASGSLIKREALEALGAFREDFFIDYVDTEFCMRAIDQGWQIIAVKDAVLHHELGAKTQHSFGVITSNHAPMRRYTIYRNRIRMWKAYCFKVPGYVSYDILASGYDVLRILCFEHQKRQKLSSILRGIKEGISNKPLKRPS